VLQAPRHVRLAHTLVLVDFGTFPTHAKHSIPIIMRVRSELWVAAYLRERRALGVMASLVRRGDPDGGAIYVKVADMRGGALLFGPAPPSMSDVVDASQLFAEILGQGKSEAEVDTYCQREIGFDPDLWLLEVEHSDLDHGLENWLRAEPISQVPWPPQSNDK